jgi:flagellar basal-body rod protein FlgB
MQRLTQTLDFQSQALVLRAERQRLLASNIANADTPGYQAREMDFANALRAATGTPGALGQGLGSGIGTGTGTGATGTALTTTHPAHGAGDFAAAEDGGLLYARNSQDSVDKNTVDVDRERASFVDNTVKYEATLRFINSGVRSMLDAMKSPSQG